MIRLGSLAGYPFEGPRLLGGWTPPAVAAVYAILYKPEPDTRPERYAVSYVGHSDDLAAERLPFQHPRAACWIARAGSRWKVHICTYEVPGGGRAHREQIARELIAVYRPSCNEQQFDNTWQDHWIGEYSAPTTGPVARRSPDESGRALLTSKASRRRPWGSRPAEADRLPCLLTGSQWRLSTWQWGVSRRDCDRSRAIATVPARLRPSASHCDRSVGMNVANHAEFRHRRS